MRGQQNVKKKKGRLFLHAVMPETTIKFLYWTVPPSKRTLTPSKYSSNVVRVWYNMLKIAWMD